MEDVLLSIKNLNHKYNEKPAISNINLEVNKGEIYGFIGRNGAGKSTTIKLIVGILPLEDGDIYIDGASLKQNSKLCKSKCAYIPDNPDLYNYLTGIGYINFICDLYSPRQKI